MTPGVPQLSLGQKAVLTATPDYVRFRVLRLVLCRLVLPSDLAHRNLGIRRARFPSCDTRECHPQIRSRAARNQLVEHAQ